jgi:hypothetical protein
MKLKRFSEIMAVMNRLPDEIYGIMTKKELIEILKMAKARKLETIDQNRARKKAREALKPDEKFWFGK